MQIKLISIISLLTGVASFSVLANNTLNSYSEYVDLNFTHNAPDNELIDEIQSRYTKFTSLDKLNASKWDLNKTEWLAYKKIMVTTNAAQLYPNVWPTDILSMYATTETEKLRFIDKTIKFERQKQQQTYQYQFAVDQRENKSLKLNLYDTTTERVQRKQPKYLRELPKFKEVRTQVFIDAAGCDDTCTNFAKNLIKTKSPASLLDFWFVNSSNNDKMIIQLATKWGVNNDDIQSYKLTINHDGGQSTKLRRKHNYRDTLPFAVRTTSYGESIVTP
ncbi:hypothetical protein UA38_12125 [Photobacterium kishitanii]|uniref:TIGR03759 family integrating conjugative element protein n=2 Tax=Photobacterium kishitanii TaxID=318456 RepID=A0AAX0YS73_9GAMM|nr:hypothetical protein [Photobacterium kishitanii]KJG57111.1 hypothetical protein UA38_12125 [Photobacterium kishitanii]KJG66183.1 hypothetical protein UA41_21295 [Photobacterium kishitanii]PSX18267.1 hypothetical protein C0W70_15460 [Photobacterium kishitanii]PSX26768.1 hypothetical protein C0W52_16395 [Photobacterium kishitanii]PSX30790.1 hypothetical protein C0W39_19795 [Photobacterium kishitanii]